MAEITDFSLLLQPRSAVYVWRLNLNTMTDEQPICLIVILPDLVRSGLVLIRPRSSVIGVSA